MTAQPGILRLPPEIRQDIFISVFRSVTIFLYKLGKRYKKGDPHLRLAILSVCRQFYLEAEPLLLPNVKIYCNSNAVVMEMLMKLGPERITQLRYLRVSQIPVAFNLEPYGGLTDADREAYGDSRKEDLNDWTQGVPKGVRHFHLGAILGLFPGLRLDLLEVFNGTYGNPWMGHHITDCFGSLLEADGYRRLWMHAANEDGPAWLVMPSTGRWKEAMERRFTSHGSGVEIKLDRDDWRDADTDELWQLARDAGITLAPAEVESDDGRDEVDTRCGFESEDVADIVANRGDGVDYAVKLGDAQVLRCIGTADDEDGAPEFFQAASDALRKLVSENSWESIRAMDGFDDGKLGQIDGPGNRVYLEWG